MGQISAAAGVAWVRKLCKALQIPPLSSYGLTSADLDILVQKGSAASSMKPNPICLTPDELRCGLHDLSRRLYGAEAVAKRRERYFERV